MKLFTCEGMSGNILTSYFISCTMSIPEVIYKTDIYLKFSQLQGLWSAGW
jgi:hypothetical protein